jgi:3-oxoacyl-[acyl-carrier protein] reductase
MGTRPNIGGEKHDGVTEVSRLADRVGEPAVIEHLQEYRPNLRMGLPRVEVTVVTCCDHWPPEVLVNNLGVMDGRSFLDLPAETFEEALEVNLIAPYRLTQRWALDLVAHEAPGSCVFISSLHSKMVRRCPDYSTSKAAASMLVKELAAELAPHRIRVNEVSPGAIDTWSDIHPTPDEHRRSSEAVVPLGMIGSPSDVAKAVLFLANDDSAGYVTGADLKIDGGLDTYTWLDHLYASAQDEAARSLPRDSD